MQNEQVCQFQLPILIFKLYDFPNGFAHPPHCDGVTINDCGPHFYNSELPFGGSNNSSISKCHGELGFLEFTNQRGVLYQARWMPMTKFFLPPHGGKLRHWILEGAVKWF